MADDEAEYPPAKRATRGRPSTKNPQIPGATKAWRCGWDNYGMGPPCEKSFGRKSDLQRHHHTHTGTRNHACPYPICGKTFIQTSALTVHIRTHTGEKPHECQLCSKRFSDSSSLARHRKIHSNERPYPCVVKKCQKSFCRKSTLNKHLQRDHVMVVGSPSDDSDDDGAQSGSLQSAPEDPASKDAAGESDTEVARAALSDVTSFRSGPTPIPTDTAPNHINTSSRSAHSAKLRATPVPLNLTGCAPSQTHAQPPTPIMNHPQPLNLNTSFGPYAPQVISYHNPPPTAPLKPYHSAYTDYDWAPISAPLAFPGAFSRTQMQDGTYSPQQRQPSVSGPAPLTRVIYSASPMHATPVYPTEIFRPPVLPVPQMPSPRVSTPMKQEFGHANPPMPLSYSCNQPTSTVPGSMYPPTSEPQPLSQDYHEPVNGGVVPQQAYHNMAMSTFMMPNCMVQAVGGGNLNSAVLSGWWNDEEKWEDAGTFGEQLPGQLFGY